MVQIRDNFYMDRKRAEIIGRCRYVLTLDPDSDDFLEACEWLYMWTGALMGADSSSLRANVEKQKRSMAAKKANQTRNIRRKRAKSAYTFRTSIYVGNRIGLGFRYRISSTGNMNDEQIYAYYN